jgi:hypothetical protein
MNKPELDTRPVRTDMTSREAARILSSLIGGLATLMDPQVLREAVVWIAVEDNFWRALQRIGEIAPATVSEAIQDIKREQEFEK